MPKYLRLYNKNGELLKTSKNIEGNTGVITIENLFPETLYHEGDFLVSWVINGNELSKAPVPEFRTLELMDNKTIVVYFSDITEEQLIALKGDSAYKIALDNGFRGTQQDWLDSLKGEPGRQGDPGKDGVDITEGGSAYEIAQAHGFEGTREEWLESLKGEPGEQGEPGEKGEPGEDGFGVDGASAYEIALENGFIGNIQDFLDSLVGEPGRDAQDGNDGLSAYQIAKEYGYTGTEQEWLDSLKGKDGNDGLSAYEIAKEYGYKGTEQEWLKYLKGDKGESLRYIDLTPQQKEELKSNITDQAVTDFVIKDGVITRNKISDEYLNNGMLPNGTDTYQVKKVGNYMGNPDGGYLNLPADFNPKKSFLLEVKTISSIWYMQIFTDFSEPMNSWKRIIRVNNDNVKNPWYRNYNLEGVKLNSQSLADAYNFREILANNTDIDTIYKAGIYTCIGTNQYINIPEELNGRSFILKTYSGRVDGAFNTQEITPMDDNSITFKRYRMYKTDKSEWAKYKAITNNNSNNNGALPLEGKSIVMFGDSITENGTYPEQFAELSKAQVIKAGFGGCRMAQHQQAGTGLLYDKQSMYRLVDYIKNKDFSELVQATEDMVRANGDDNRPQAFRLRDTNWDNVDYITIFFGTNDYGGDIPIGNNEDTDGTTFKGAVNKVIKTLGESVPHIKIMFITPFYRSRFISGDNKDSDNFVNAAGAKLNDYVQAIEELAEKNHIPVLNMMKESGINKYNSEKYLSDGLHPNTFGYTYLAEQFSKKLPYKL